MNVPPPIECLAPCATAGRPNGTVDTGNVRRSWLPIPRGAARALRSWRLFLASGGFVLLLEPVDPSGRIYQLLSAGKERVAGGADFHADVAFVRGARFKGMSAGADDVNFVVCGVNTCLHDVKGSPFPRNPV